MWVHDIFFYVALFCVVYMMPATTFVYVDVFVFLFVRGIVPQCGFSVLAADLYSRRQINGYVLLHENACHVHVRVRQNGHYARPSRFLPRQQPGAF